MLSLSVNHEPSSLLQHVHHRRLKDRIYSLDTDTGTALRHGIHINNLDRVVVDEFTQHQAHDLHRYPGPPVAQHFEQRKRGDVYGFGIIKQFGIVLLFGDRLLPRVVG